MKKIIAPAVISSLLVLYYIAAVVLLCVFTQIPVYIKIITGIIAAALCGVTVFVFMERIREIRKGEEDDLGNY